jgi:hypothetical protein
LHSGECGYKGTSQKKFLQRSIENMSYLISLTLSLALHTAPAADPKATPLGPVVFKQLSTLVGDWESTSADRNVKVSYRMTANNSVVVETWTMSPTRESMTLYALDGDQLLLTHFCPQGNQPRLRLNGVDKQGRYQFVFQDGTNLQNKDAEHEHAVWLKIDSSELFTRGETYIPNTERRITHQQADVISFRRVTPN